MPAGFQWTVEGEEDEALILDPQPEQIWMAVMNPVGTPAWLEHCIPCSVLRGETDAERGIQNLNIRVRI